MRTVSSKVLAKQLVASFVAEVVILERINLIVYFQKLKFENAQFFCVGKKEKNQRNKIKRFKKRKLEKSYIVCYILETTIPMRKEGCTEKVNIV